MTCSRRCTPRRWSPSSNAGVGVSRTGRTAGPTQAASVATVAACMLVGFAILTLGVRVIVQLRATGETGLVGLRSGAGPIDWLSGILFVAGMAMGVVSIILVLQDTLDPIEALDTTPIHVAGIALAAAGGLAVFLAQMGMGSSWRIGVSDDQDTDLVTTGWFSLVR